MTTREFLESLGWPACAYRRKVRAVQRDHVVPRDMRRHFAIAENDARFHVPACRTCNEAKYTFKVYPVGFDVSILPGNPKAWREWRGDSRRIARSVVLRAGQSPRRLVAGAVRREGG